MCTRLVISQNMYNNEFYLKFCIYFYIFSLIRLYFNIADLYAVIWHPY